MTDLSAGFQGLQAELTTVGKQTHWITYQVIAGRLRIDQSHGKDAQ